MIIGTFRSIDESFVGHIVSIGLGRVAAVMIPLADQKTYELLSEGAGEDLPMIVGRAVHKTGDKGGFLLVKIDCPTFTKPIEATMSMTSSRQGIYTLEWNRTVNKKQPLFTKRKHDEPTRKMKLSRKKGYQ